MVAAVLGRERDGGRWCWGVTAGEGRSDDESGEREHRGEGEDAQNGGPSGAEASVQAPEQGDAQYQTDQVEHEIVRFPQDRGGFRYAASGWASAVVLASKAMGDIMAAEL